MATIYYSKEYKLYGMMVFSCSAAIKNTHPKKFLSPTSAHST